MTSLPKWLRKLLLQSKRLKTKGGFGSPFDITRT
jgi:hypothetical protein